MIKTTILIGTIVERCCRWGWLHVLKATGRQGFFALPHYFLPGWWKFTSAMLRLHDQKNWASKIPTDSTKTEAETDSFTNKRLSKTFHCIKHSSISNSEFHSTLIWSVGEEMKFLISTNMLPSKMKTVVVDEAQGSAVQGELAINIAWPAWKANFNLNMEAGMLWNQN